MNRAMHLCCPASVSAEPAACTRPATKSCLSATLILLSCTKPNSFYTEAWCSIIQQLVGSLQDSHIHSPGHRHSPVYSQRPRALHRQPGSRASSARRAGSHQPAHFPAALTFFHAPPHSRFSFCCAFCSRSQSPTVPGSNPSETRKTSIFTIAL